MIRLTTMSVFTPESGHQSEGGECLLSANRRHRASAQTDRIGSGRAGTIRRLAGCPQ